MSLSQTPKLLPLAASLLVLYGCGSSTIEEPLRSQAVDGFLVQSDVDCDGVASQRTGAAGRLSCPAGTKVVDVTGGYDVGSDEEATTGDIPFNGTLSALADSPVVTPLTSMLIESARATLGDDLSEVNIESIQTEVNLATAVIADAFDIPASLFSTNPVENLRAAKVNSSIVQLTNAFASTEGDYRSVKSALTAYVLEAGNTGGGVNLETDVAGIMTAMNNRLRESDSALALATADLDARVGFVSLANQRIANASSPDGVFTVSRQQYPSLILKILSALMASTGHRYSLVLTRCLSTTACL